MRVGITCHIEYSVFSSGTTNTCIALAELMNSFGHTTTLLNIKGRQDWWEDCQPLKKMFPVAHLSSLDLSGQAQPFDLILEVGSLTVTPLLRRKLATKSIWIVRKSLVLSEIESSIFPTVSGARDLDGITEAWLLRDVTAPDDTTFLETLARVPVRRLPFLWSPLPAEAHYRSVGAPAWKWNIAQPLVVHMVDTNTSSTSSSTIPLVTMREAARRKLPIGTWRLHNGEMIAKSKFFKENVLKHCSDLDLSGSCVGRQRCVEWAAAENSVAMAHLRFIALRPVLLDLAWIGIPVIHNSPALRAIGFGADKLYYTDNSIEEACGAFEWLLADMRDGSRGWAATGGRRKEQLLRNWSPISPLVRSEWQVNLLHCLGNAIAAVPAPVAPLPLANATPVVATPSVTRPPEFRIVFCDMWDGFQPEYNFFTLLLNDAGKSMSPPKKVIGISHENWAQLYPGENPDLVVFSPFGNCWQAYDESVPRVHFTGENTPRVKDHRVKLNLGFLNETNLDAGYMRLPLWMLEINWFGADVDRLVNPRPIPLELATRSAADTLAERSKFCSFIVTNPRNPVRNQAFHWLSQYKQVDSGGALYNTIGDALAAMRGGGGGELKKVKFNMQYKFALSYENESSSGYTTEKYLHAKAAGCVPIYWGDPHFQRDFDPAGCIDARNFRTPEELIAAVRAVDTDDEEWCRRAAVPALDAYRVDLTRRAFSECAGRMWQILGATKEEIATIPRFLGCAPGSSGAQAGMEYFTATTPVAAAVAASPPPAAASAPPIVTTFASFKFLGSLQHWLLAISAQARAIPDLQAIVFLSSDVPIETEAALKEKHKFLSTERIPSDWTPPDFPDFWDPSNYAWKIWLYHTLVNRSELKGSLILYMDAGSVLCRWPTAWLKEAHNSGICALEDPREENDRWCGDMFCELLKVTDEERAAKQIVAGLMTFVAGAPLAVAFFNEAFQLAQNRNILIGPRLSGVSTDGKSYGHRQDQSILSILVRRHPIPLQPLDTVYGDHSLRRTYQRGQAIYVHRGNFQKSIPFLTGVEDAWVINLDRREDRLTKFFENHPTLADRVNRCTAVDGKTLQLTPELAKLFTPNDFFWKKSVMGCALSHLSLWWKLVNDHPDIHNYLIFEDDAKMIPGWEEELAKSMAHVPEDYDVLYLGGILPPNREGFEKVLEPVTKYYSRVKPHQFFGQPTPTRYFHSCAYAYILSRNGALKIMKMLAEHSGYWTSADHIMCSPCDTMNLYFLTPPVAGCFQDEDPAYANSDFNDFSRVDKFDSDLWNNDERFSKEEIGACIAAGEREAFDIGTVLRKVYGDKPLASDKPPAKIVTTPDTEPEPLIPIHPTVPHTVLKGGVVLPTRFVTIEEFPIDFSKVYERDWLFALLGGIQTLDTVTVKASDPPPTDCPIVVLQRPHVLGTTKMLFEWSKAGAKFKILHLSDESPEPALRDPLVAYQLPGCVSILRFYVRDDFPPGTEDKINVIPLGFRWSPLNLRCNPLERTPNLPFRELHWSFFGTNWNKRADEMKPLTDTKLIQMHKFYDGWNDPAALERQDYLAMMVNSIFIPCPSGVNPETFRFYEALDAGCIPIVLRTEENEEWFKWVSEHIPLVSIETWEDAVRIMMTLLAKPERMEVYRNQLMNAWWAWTQKLKQQATRWLLAV